MYMYMYVQYVRTDDVRMYMYVDHVQIYTLQCHAVYMHVQYVIGLESSTLFLQIPSMLRFC